MKREKGGKFKLRYKTVEKSILFKEGLLKGQSNFLQLKNIGTASFKGKRSCVKILRGSPLNQAGALFHRHKNGWLMA
jgi:hypothetical protein